MNAPAEEGSVGATAAAWAWPFAAALGIGGADVDAILGTGGSSEEMPPVCIDFADRPS